MQNSEEDQFLYETSVQASVRDTVAELAKIYNLRHKITRLKLEGEELAKYGPAKQPDKQGIDQYSEEPVQKGEFYCMDPTGRRTGNGEATILSKAIVVTLLWVILAYRQQQQQVQLTQQVRSFSTCMGLHAHLVCLFCLQRVTQKYQKS